MYIKRLEIVGFKSFPERASVPLSQGISAVVGPNGCGKSNIIDAIRWVMGEQSPRMLRGRNMDDVLFNGSQGRPASALAEVTLTLARDRDPEAGYLTAAESSVTRRLYRSGDSEYLINKVPCRLKDVVHFFMDAGVGTRAYGIIEQGRVGWLVDARPEERRGLIDEAAGITRYKQQKKEAERKIESAEANLVNVSVIKAETKKQLDQITRAAAKAARYKALREELRELDLGLSARALTQARKKKKDVETSREENRKLLTSLLAEADRHELETQNIKLAVAQTEKELEEKTTAWHQLVSAHDGLKKEAEFTRSNLARSEERRVQALGELARIASERRRKLEEEAGLSEELVSLEREESEARQHTDTLREEWRAMKTAFDALGREHQEAASRGAASEREAAQLAAELAGAESLLAHHRQRLEAMADEAAEAEAEAAEAAGQLEYLTRQKKSRQLELESARDEAAFRAEEVILAERELATLTTQVSTAESRLAATRAKLETLRDVKDNFGWYPQGVKALMAAPELASAGLIGPLAEFLEIPDGYEEAVEAALGERLAWILVRDRSAALAALDFLRANNLGRCGFICRDEMEASGSELARAVLGDFQLAENLISAAEVSSPVLTRSGEYAGHGLVAGGRPGDSQESDAGLLARLKEVEALEREEEKASKAFEDLGRRVDEARENAAVAREAARAADAARAALETRLTETDKAMALAGSESARAEARHQSLEAERSKTEKEAEELTASLVDGRARRQAASEAAAEAGQKAAELAERVAEQSEALEELRSSGEDARLASAAASERLDRGRHDLARVTEWLNEVEDNLAAKEAESAALAEEIERFTQRAEELDNQAASFPERLSAAESDLSETRARLDEQRRRQTARENEMREVRRRREDLNSIITGQETEILSTGFSIEKIEEDLRRDWKIVMLDPDAVPEPLIEEHLVEEDITLSEPDDENPDDDADDVETEEADSEQQTPPAPPAIEIIDPRPWVMLELPDGAAARRDSLRTKIGSLGEVSLGAIEKEVELRDEYNRYQTQYDDLTRAISDLKDSINKINHTCKILFGETFKAVDEKFREIFPILFEGGEGWISLTDESDPLESGVEIHVHPPGKKVLVMSLLSGGEKALTALALIFALYLIKPSPFCLLDETDAPLDEANIDRFNRLLKQLSRASQIIMVTHNKRTMQISHTLYGVTMETPGVSKLVSVNLAEAEAMTTDV
ncbi:chromosome segregation protein SMC [Deltaproteobacteria bacterium Smac51]|nr:chromosome segregation protein SMC [Deltaproteobacteria bacterium Smac51]